MSGLYLILSLFFLIPYLLAQILPGKKSLTGYLFLSAILLWSQGSGDGPGAIFSIFSDCLGWGAALGTAVRGTNLFLTYQKVSPKYNWALLILSPFLLWVAVSIPQYHHKWKYRAPSNDCSYNFANIKIGNTSFKVSTFPFISVGLDDGNKPINEIDSLYFFSNESLRKLCSMSNDGKEAVFANLISFKFYKLEAERFHNKRFKMLCEKSDYFFCQERYLKVIPYIEDIDLYFDGHYNADRMLGGTGHNLVKELQNSASNNAEKTNNKYHYRMLRGLKSFDGKDIFFRCKKKATDGLFCQSNIKISSDVRLIVGYVVSKENANRDILQLYQKTQNLLGEIILIEDKQ